MEYHYFQVVGQKSTRRRLAAGSFLLCFFFSAALCPLFAQADDEKARGSRSRTAANESSAPQEGADDSFLSKLLRTSSSPDGARTSAGVLIAQISTSFLLAALLSAAVAFRPRKKFAAFSINPYVAQTQILLSVIAAAMMIIVSDNAARAFGIFAAASLVRYRTNIRDPKETSVLLACLGIGLAAGVRRWELALLLTAFVMVVLLLLESLEPKQVFRTLELKVKSYDVEKTDALLKRLFTKQQLQTELRKIDLTEKEGELGTLLYCINAPPTVSTDKLTELFFSTDPDNIDTIEWEQKKSSPYLYR